MPFVLDLLFDGFLLATPPRLIRLFGIFKVFLCIFEHLLEISMHRRISNLRVVLRRHLLNHPKTMLFEDSLPPRRGIYSNFAVVLFGRFVLFEEALEFGGVVVGVVLGVGGLVGAVLVLGLVLGGAIEDSVLLGVGGVGGGEQGLLLGLATVLLEEFLLLLVDVLVA